MKVQTTKNRVAKKAQSVTEYAILLGVVIAVFAGMQVYVKRGLNAKIKTVADAQTQAGVGNFTLAKDASGNPLYLNISQLSQYEPYSAESQSNTFSQSEEGSSTVSGKASRSSKSISGQAKGSYRSEKTNKNVDDSMWH